MLRFNLSQIMVQSVYILSILTGQYILSILTGQYAPMVIAGLCSKYTKYVNIPLYYNILITPKFSIINGEPAADITGSLDI